MSRRKLQTYAIVIVFLTASICYLEGSTGSTGWVIFRRVRSPKPKPITTVIAVRGDLSGVLYNPSVLATVTQREVFALGELGLTEDKVTGAIFAYPMTVRQSAISVGILSYDANKMTLYWIEDGQEKEKTVTAQSDLLCLLSFGKAFTDKFHVGITAKFATSNIAEAKTASAYAADIGGTYYLTDKIAISIAAQNLGTATKFFEKAEKLPSSVWFGIGYHSFISSLGEGYYVSFGGDIPYILDENRVTPEIGIEFGKLPISFFVGYRFNIQEGILNFGLALNLKKFDLSVSYIPTLYLSPTYRIAFGFRF